MKHVTILDEEVILHFCSNSLHYLPVFLILKSNNFVNTNIFHLTDRLKRTSHSFQIQSKMSKGTEVLLQIVTFGIILSTVYIQPAQGLKCYLCKECRNSQLGIVQHCPENETYCAWGELVLEDGYTIGHRSCAKTTLIEDNLEKISCDEFKPSIFGNPEENLRLCHCQSDLCNKDDIHPNPDTVKIQKATIPSKASSFTCQLLVLQILLPVLLVFCSSDEVNV